MSVYVDRLMSYAGWSKHGWRYSHACHMAADTLDELHAFAASIGLKREWFQRKNDRPHYDLTKTKRAMAVGRGAIEVSPRRIIEIIKRLGAK